MNDKVTFLPHVKEHFKLMEKAIEELIQTSRYEDALQQIDELRAQAYETESLFVQKLHCLAQLEAWTEVEGLVEALYEKNTGKYQDEYNLYYFLSLYNQAQYKLVVELMDERPLPESTAEEIEQTMKHIYEASKREIDEEAQSIEKQMQMAILSTNEQKQWQLFHQWSQLDVRPPAMFIDMLAHPDVNLFVKTFIIEALQTWQIDEKVRIQKGNQEIETTISNLLAIEKNPIFKQTYTQLEEIEHFNPTLFELSKDLFQRYIEYVYPFLYSQEEVIVVSEAVFLVANYYLEGSMKEEFDSENLQHYVNEVSQSNEAYFKLMLT